MGIKDLRPFLEKKCSNLVIEVPIKKLMGQRIAIDIMVFLYKYLRSVGEDNWIPFMIQNLSVFARHRVDIVCVFDGKDVPSEKEKERERRRSDSQNIYTKIAELETLITKIKKEHGPIEDSQTIKEVNAILAKQRKIEGYSIINFNKRSTILWVLNESLSKWKKQTLFVTEEHIKTTKELCGILRIPVYQAKGEGETVCACLCLNDEVDAVYTEDTDVLAYGCPMQLYGFDAKKETVKLVYLKDVLNCLDFNYEQFRDFCIMLKCDYNDRVPGVGPVKSYDLLHQCDFIEGILETSPETLPGKTLQHACRAVQKNYSYLNYERCRELFSYKKVARVKWRDVKSIDYNAMDNFLKKHGLYTKYRNAENLLSVKDWQPTPMKFIEL